MNGYPGAVNSVRPGDIHPIPYTPVPSIGAELGIMFGFIMLSLVTMLLYWYFWQAAQKRNAAIEAARREALTAQERQRRSEKHPEQSMDYNSEHDDLASGAVDGIPSRSTRNGTSANGFGLGNTMQDLIV
ncbi:hypothetical protein AJ78_06607 [Emergomyces pasteurianus Ep9510]|uniref:Uncharacterized protein n=1 Tax=Emergomyces pasteurianus Ep9510 TaxID=1447872 RepID=A0A1J9P8B2_9EURO|nr:hypothetical protein AJ78_06607 [Emergomyces pasteurianus Ep9510]